MTLIVILSSIISLAFPGQISYQRLTILVENSEDTENKTILQVKELNTRESAAKAKPTHKELL